MEEPLFSCGPISWIDKPDRTACIDWCYPTFCATKMLVLCVPLSSIHPGVLWLERRGFLPRSFAAWIVELPSTPDPSPHGTKPLERVNYNFCHCNSFWDNAANLCSSSSFLGLVWTIESPFYPMWLSTFVLCFLGLKIFFALLLWFLVLSLWLTTPTQGISDNIGLSWYILNLQLDRLEQAKSNPACLWLG